MFVPQKPKEERILGRNLWECQISRKMGTEKWPLDLTVVIDTPHSSQCGRAWDWW